VDTKSDSDVLKEVEEAFEKAGIFPTLKHEHGEIIGVKKLEEVSRFSSVVNAVAFNGFGKIVSLCGISFKPASSDQLDIVKKTLEGEKGTYQSWINSIDVLIEKIDTAHT
jgi:hypothetical protein